jgi:hypothetical protein
MVQFFYFILIIFKIKKRNHSILNFKKISDQNERNVGKIVFFVSENDKRYFFELFFDSSRRREEKLKARESSLLSETRTKLFVVSMKKFDFFQEIL